MIPRPHQQQSIESLVRIIRTHGAALDASDCGTGKTLTAIEVMRHLQLPTLVTCPKIVRPAWVRHAQEQGDSISTINWEMLARGTTPYGRWIEFDDRRKKPRFVFNEAIRFLIFDEIHRAMGIGTKNSDMVKAARRQNIPCLGLSATPADSPTEMDALGYILRLHDSYETTTLRDPRPKRTFYQWAINNGCRPGDYSFLEFAGDEAERVAKMEAIRQTIFPEHGVRVRVSDIPDFPECQLTAELYEFGDERQMEQLYRTMGKELLALQQRHEHCEQERLKRARERGFLGLELEELETTKLLRARQGIELLKVPGMVNLTRDAVQQGMSVALFVNFSRTIEALRNELETDCFIDGSQTGQQGAEEREYNRERFQNDTERVIIVNTEAGGLGCELHDIHGRFPRLSLFSPGYNAKNFRQATKRTHRFGARSKSIQRVLLAAGTREEQVYRKVSVKLSCLDALLDEDLMPDFG